MQPRADMDAVVLILSHSKKDFSTGALVRVTKRGKPSLTCIVSCKHCVHKKEMQTVILDYDVRNRPNLRAHTSPETLYVESEKSDVCLCALHPQTNPDDRSFFSVDTRVPRHEAITVLQHPNAAPTTASAGRILNDIPAPSSRCHAFLHDADTLPGSSGGCILVKRRGKTSMVGVHCEAIDVAVGREEIPLNVGYSLGCIVSQLKRMGFAIS